MSNQNLELPPSYIEPNNINTWLLDIFNSPHGLPCICGDQTEGREPKAVRAQIIRICQRQDNPCFVEIDFHLGTAQGIYSYIPSQSGFSLDTTDGLNGVWFELRPSYSHASHNPSLNNISLIGTSQVDGTWPFTIYDPANPTHITNDPCIANYVGLGIPIHKFIFNMCEHISSWSSENTIAFRLTFDKVSVYSDHCHCSCTTEFNNL